MVSNASEELGPSVHQPEIKPTGVCVSVEVDPSPVGPCDDCGPHRRSDCSLCDMQSRGASAALPRFLTETDAAPS